VQIPGDIVKSAAFDPATGSFEVPARTVAVFTSQALTGPVPAGFPQVGGP
jgi:hypothetical protein